jgi:hypothetical protein
LGRGEGQWGAEGFAEQHQKLIKKFEAEDFSKV